MSQQNPLNFIEAHQAAFDAPRYKSDRPAQSFFYPRKAVRPTDRASLDNGTTTTHRQSKPRQRDNHKVPKRRKTLVDKQNLMPQQAQPISRITNGQLPTQLAELTEEVLGGSAGSSSVLPAGGGIPCAYYICSYDGDDAE